MVYDMGKSGRVLGRGVSARRSMKGDFGVVRLGYGPWE